MKKYAWISLLFVSGMIVSFSLFEIFNQEEPGNSVFVLLVGGLILGNIGLWGYKKIKEKHYPMVTTNNERIEEKKHCQSAN